MLEQAANTQQPGSEEYRETTELSEAIDLLIERAESDSGD